MGVSLQSHPDVIEAGRNALRDYGAGLSSVRFICGTQVVIIVGVVITYRRYWGGYGSVCGVCNLATNSTCSCGALRNLIQPLQLVTCLLPGYIISFFVL